jgi:hypothetical protein
MILIIDVGSQRKITTCHKSQTQIEQRLFSLCWSLLNAPTTSLLSIAKSNLCMDSENIKKHLLTAAVHINYKVPYYVTLNPTLDEDISRTVKS